jgi:rod shape-determining protein MreC
MLGFGILSLFLGLLDHNSDYLDDVRSSLNFIVTPIFYMAELPANAGDTLSRVFTSRERMQEDIRNLKRQLLLLKAKTEKMASLSAENARLRRLLGSSEKLEDNVLITELIGINPDPESLILLLDKGSQDGVYPGQPVLDAEGLVGQIVEVSDSTSRALLITDASHSVPVQVTRNDLKLIATGSGRINELELNHVQDTADIRVGDLLVSSGLGQRFPVGYPVGVVTEVTHDPGRPFAVVKARPSAHLDRSRHLLLVFTAEQMSARESRVRELEDGS